MKEVDRNTLKRDTDILEGRVSHSDRIKIDKAWKRAIITISKYNNSLTKSSPRKTRREKE